MRTGDRVHIWDSESEFFIFEGEVLKIFGNWVLVMLMSKGRIVGEFFPKEKLYPAKKRTRRRKNVS